MIVTSRSGELDRMAEKDSLVVVFLFCFLLSQ